MVKKVSGTDFKIDPGARRSGDPAVLVASAQKARDELGWQPRHSGLEEIVQSAWEVVTTMNKK